MRVFWSIIGVFVIATIVVVAPWQDEEAEGDATELTALASDSTPRRPRRRDRGEDAATNNEQKVDAAMQDEPQVAPDTANAIDESPRETESPSDKSDPEVRHTSDDTTSDDTTSDVATSDDGPTATVPSEELPVNAATVTETEEPASTGESEDSSATSTDAEGADDATAGDGTNSDPNTIVADDPGTATAEDTAADNAPEEETNAAEATEESPTEPVVAETVIIQREDGSMLVDDRFEIRGEGTAQNPYQISWDLLISASETYAPSRGKKQLPGRITMLHGRHITIHGYLAFPVASQSPKDMLSMLNQWDGCCIGVPPTPYDAIEVTLAKGMPGAKRQVVNYGSVTGVLNVDPYLVENWLIGLYLLDDAEVDVEM